MSQSVPQSVPQPGRNTFRELYTYHVGRASYYELQANTLMEQVRARKQRTNPDASVEWIDVEVSNNHFVKAAISKQQFHTREAIKYMGGMVMEGLGHSFSVKTPRQEFYDALHNTSLG